MNVVILTGNGMSSECGVPIFGSGSGNEYNIWKVASKNGFFRNPKRALDFHRNFKDKCKKAKPNKAYDSLVELETKYPENVSIITQNLDGLHKRSGNNNVIELFGNIFEVIDHSGNGGYIWEDLENEDFDNSVPNLRPNIVWFGEKLYGLREAYSKLNNCDIFISIGISGNFSPVSEFIFDVKKNSRKIEINPNETIISNYFNENIRKTASESVPLVINNIMEYIRYRQKR